MIFSKDFDLFSAIQKVRLSEKTSEILGQVSEKMKLESLAGLDRYNIIIAPMNKLHIRPTRPNPTHGLTRPISVCDMIEVKY